MGISNLPLREEVCNHPEFGSCFFFFCGVMPLLCTRGGGGSMWHSPMYIARYEGIRSEYCLGKGKHGFSPLVHPNCSESRLRNFGFKLILVSVFFFLSLDCQLLCALYVVISWASCILSFMFMTPVWFLSGMLMLVYMSRV